jgi:hypothetical protein
MWHEDCQKCNSNGQNDNCDTYHAAGVSNAIHRGANEGATHSGEAGHPGENKCPLSGGM